jgi:pyridoxine 4-dehydrogenase
MGDVGGAIGGSIEQPLTVLAELKHQGLILHLDLSNVSPQQLVEAQKISDIVRVQNLYNVAHRNDDSFVDDLARQISLTFHSSRWEDLLRCSALRSTRPQRL